jgi:hypothetical protein
MATKSKKEKTAEELFNELYVQRYPVRAAVIRFMAKLIAGGITLGVVFIAITVVYALFKWAIGVWV